MIAGAHGAIMRSSTKLVEKRNNFLKENIAHLDEDQQKVILEKKNAIAKKYTEKISQMFRKISTKQKDSEK
jgi:Tfp pilus assembly protein PilN